MSAPIMDGLPTVEEILSGKTQAGVPRPPSMFADDDDGPAHRVGSLPRTSSAPRMSRWAAIKQLLAIIFGGKGVE